MVCTRAWQEAYSVARQFNLIPPICEQAEYHMFQREKVEVQLPELFHKIGTGPMPPSPHPTPAGRAGARGAAGSAPALLPRRRCYDLVPAGLRHRLREVRRRHPPLLPGIAEGEPRTLQVPRDSWCSGLPQGGAGCRAGGGCAGEGVQRLRSQELGTFWVTFSMESTARHLQGAGPVPYARGWDRRRARDRCRPPSPIPRGTSG